MKSPKAKPTSAQAMAPRVGWTLALLLVLTALGCRGPAAADGGAGIQIDIIQRPTTGQPTRIAISLADPTGAPQEGATVEVEGNMTHAGMVPVLARATESGGGRYVVEGFVFTMAGDWIITVRAMLADGRRVERSFDVRGLVGGHVSAVGPRGQG